MKLLIIRHGESEADVLRVHEGRADFELTGLGHRQTIAMSEYVAANYRLDKIYSSTLRRAMQTAGHLSEATGVPLTPDPLLMEFDNGLIAGLPYEEANEKYPPASVPRHDSLYGQESMLSFRFRAENMLSKLLSENGEDSVVAAVSHGGMIQQLYRAFLRLPVDSKYAFSSGDAAIHEWQVSGDTRTVIRANFIPPLGPSGAAE